MAKGGQMGGGFSNLRDMFDGGGMGRAGQRFEGGPLSGMLNDMGIRPNGFQERLAQQRPQMRPVSPMPQPQMPQPPMPQPQEYLSSGRGDFGMPTTGKMDMPGGEVMSPYYQQLMSRAMMGDEEARMLLSRLMGTI